MIRVLFVCMGNICRSPTAQGVFEHRLRGAGLAHVVSSDSAGTHGYHINQPPDPRAMAAAAARGFDLASQRARQATPEDFNAFDLVLAMDRQNLHALERMAPRDQIHRLEMFLSFAPELGLDEVPDPYYGPGNGFERVLDIVEAGADGLLEHIRKNYEL